MQLGGKMFSAVSFKLPLCKNMCQSRIEGLKLQVDIDCNFFPKLNKFKYALNA